MSRLEFVNFNDDIENVISTIVEGFKTYFEKEDDNNLDQNKKRIIQISKCIILIEKLFNNFDFLTYDNNNIKVNVSFELRKTNYNLELIDLLSEIIFLCNQIFTEKKLVVFSWWDLSMGEISLLNSFAKIQELQDLNQKNKIKENVLITIDETEAYLNPQWQKEYLNKLIKGYSVLLKDYQLQFILTSHSPFVCSDLPKENIIFLDKNEDGTCKVVKDEELKSLEKTFGQNIHTLLSNSFFLEGGLIGDFAKDKINEILDFYEKVKVRKKEIEEKKKVNYEELEVEYKDKQNNFKYIQSIIGEEYLAQVIQNHLDEIERILYGTIPTNKERLRTILKNSDFNIVKELYEKLEKENQKE